MAADIRTWAQVVSGDEILGGWTVARRWRASVDLVGPDGAARRGSPRSDSAVTIVTRGELGRVVDMFTAAGLGPTDIRETV